MTQNEIIEMAKQAGIIAVHTEGDGNWMEQFIALEAFAKLVAEREREACAKVCDELFESSEPVSDESGDWVLGTKDCASAIRARQ